MSENRIISFIHDIRSLDRKWKNLTAEQKKKLLEMLNDEISESSVLIAIRRVRRAK